MAPRVCSREKMQHAVPRRRQIFRFRRTINYRRTYMKAFLICIQYSLAAVGFLIFAGGAQAVDENVVIHQAVANPPSSRYQNMNVGVYYQGSRGWINSAMLRMASGDPAISNGVLHGDVSLRLLDNGK